MLFDENFSLESKITVIAILALAGVGLVLFLLHGSCMWKYLVMRRKTRGAGSVNSFEFYTKERRTYPGVRRAYYAVYDYSFELGNDKFHDARFFYRLSLWEKLFFKNLPEYGDEFDVVYDKNDPAKNIPLKLIRTELLHGLPGIIFLFLAYMLIVVLMLFI